MAGKLKVKLVRSAINRPAQHKKTLRSMGLTRVGREREYPDNPAIRGMIVQVQHLVEVRRA